jgi:hypothetical protein
MCEESIASTLAHVEQLAAAVEQANAFARAEPIHAAAAAGEGLSAKRGTRCVVTRP